MSDAWLYGLLGVIFWAALCAYSLRVFAYSRLEELATRKGRPERFRTILRQQDFALLTLEVLQTLATLGWCAQALTHVFVESSDPIRGVARYLMVALVLLLANNLIPWLASRVASEATLYYSWPLISLFQLLLRPVLALVRGVDRITHRASGRGEPEAAEAAVIGDELRTVVDEGQREGVIESDAGEMITRVIEFQDEEISAIMTPRTDIFYLDVNASLEQARQKLVESGHSRVPVRGDSPDDVLGLLYAKDLLNALAPTAAGSAPATLREILRQPIYIPITTRIPDLLEQMKRQKVQIAMVLDEYGGVAGLVTMEDILEEIVGEIADEFDTEETSEQPIVEVGDGTYEADGRVHLDDLNERLDLDLPEDGEYDTIGGFVFSQIGRVPSAGESIAWKQWRIVVVGADKRKITRLRFESAEVAEPSESTSSE